MTVKGRNLLAIKALEQREEEGKQADLLILGVPDYRHLGYRFGTNLARQVVKRGRVYSVDVGYYQTA